jgi:hypothetical protein
MNQALLNLKQDCIDFISNYQDSNGEFKTYLFFPGKAENGWIYSGPSVFITSSTAICLLNVEGTEDIRKKAANYVRSQMEKGGLWRFYPHHGLFKFNTPLDVDDTSLASYLLEKEQIAFPNNKDKLYKQLNKYRTFRIWFLPRTSLIRNPIFWFRLLFDLKYSWPIFFPLKGRTNSPLIALSDNEHAVNANVLLYLGKNDKSQCAINHLIEDVLFGNKHNLFFYPSYLIIYYHVSRLFEDGIVDVLNTKKMVESYLTNQSTLVKENVFNKAIALLTLCNYRSELALVDELAEEIATTTKNELFCNYAYFCTKDRNMLGGSEALSAVLKKRTKKLRSYI